MTVLKFKYDLEGLIILKVYIVGIDPKWDLWQITIGEYQCFWTEIITPAALNSISFKTVAGKLLRLIEIQSLTMISQRTMWPEMPSLSKGLNGHRQHHSIIKRKACPCLGISIERGHRIHCTSSCLRTFRLENAALLPFQKTGQKTF